MALKLFKSGDDLYEESKELINRGEFQKARSILVRSIEKEGGVDDVAAVQVALIDLAGNLTEVEGYQKLLGALERLKSTGTIQFGLDTVDAEELKTECALTIRKMRLLSEAATKGVTVKQIQELAQDYQSRIGNKSLIVHTLFKKDTSVTGYNEFCSLMAISYESWSDAVVFDDPQQAAEYQQIAAGYRQQNGQSSEANLKKVKAYSKTCTCWVCGRIATGEGIHFYSAPAEVSPSLKDKESSAAESRADSEHIFICRACYTAISKRSDEISKTYYEDCIRQMRAMEARLQAEIAAIESNVALMGMRR